MVKKIAIIYAGAKYWGGVETYLENLFRYIDKSKIELHFISIGEWDLSKKLKIKNNKIKIITGRWYQLANLKLINKFLKENKMDLVVSQGMVGIFYARMATIFTKIPNIIIIHSDWKYDYSLPKKLIFWISNRLFRFATKKYVAVSKHLRKRLTDEGIKADNIKVVYNGIAIDIIPTKAKESKNKSTDNNQDSGSFIIGSVGRLHYVKNYQNLVKAMNLLKNKDWRLEIIGDGNERTKLEDLIRNYGLEDKIFLLGQIDNLEECYKKWDLYVQPSLSEGFGLTTIEAMFSGLPVIVTPCGSLPELVGNGKVGIIASGTEPIMLAEKIKGAINGDYDLKNISIKGQKFVKENFTIDIWIRKTEKTFLEVIK